MAASPYLISGQMNFGSAPAAGDYQSAYANALSMNSQLYNNILAGYQGLSQAQQAAQQPIEAGYNQLTDKVLQDISGIGASQAQAINDAYAQASGGASQSMINRGLSNTTARDAVQRGLIADREKSRTALANQLASLTAGYRSNLGSQALGYGAQAIRDNSQLGMEQLRWMNTVSAPYPQARDFMQLAQMRGAVGAGQRAGANIAIPRGSRVGSAGPAMSTGGVQGANGMSARGFAPSLGYMTGYNPNNYAGMNTPSGSAAAYNWPAQELKMSGPYGGASLGTSGGQQGLPFGSDIDYNDIRGGGSGVPGGWNADDEAQYQGLDQNQYETPQWAQDWMDQQSMPDTNVYDYGSDADSAYSGGYDSAPALDASFEDWGDWAGWE